MADLNRCMSSLSEKGTEGIIYKEKCKELGIISQEELIKSLNSKSTLKISVSAMTVFEMEAVYHALIESPKIIHLKLFNNSIGDKGAELIADLLESNSNLKVLFLRNNHIGEQGAIKIAEALYSDDCALAELSIAENSIGDRGSTAIADALCINSTVSKLSIRDCAITDSGVISMRRLLEHNDSLVKLALESNKIGATGTRYIVEGLLKNSTLQEISLMSNPIQNEGFESLCMVLNRFSNFNCSNCNISTVGASKFYQRLIETFSSSLSNVRSLDLSDNRLASRGVSILCKSLGYFTHLTDLYLENNKIGDKGVIALADHIKSHKTLAYLTLRLNLIQDVGAQTLIEVLCSKENFESINLKCNHISSSMCDYLTELARKNGKKIDLDDQNEEEPIVPVEREEKYFNLRDELKRRIDDIWNEYVNDCRKRKIEISEPLRDFVRVLAGESDDDPILDAPHKAHLAGSHLGEAGIHCLSQILESSETVAELNLNNVGLSPADVALLLDSLSNNTNTNISKVTMKDNYLKAGIIPLLLEFLARYEESHPNSCEFDLERNFVGDEGCEKFLDLARKGYSISKICLGKNGITQEGAKALAQIFAIDSAGLYHLDLDCNEIKNEGAQHLCEAMTRSCHLDTLSLRNSNLTAQSVDTFAGAVNSCLSLKTLKLDSNNLQDSGCCTLVEKLSTKSTLSTLSLKMNNVSPEILSDLRQKVKERIPSLSHFEIDASRMYRNGANFRASITSQRFSLANNFDTNDLELSAVSNSSSLVGGMNGRDDGPHSGRYELQEVDSCHEENLTEGIEAHHLLTEISEKDLMNSKSVGEMSKEVSQINALLVKLQDRKRKLMSAHRAKLHLSNQGKMNASSRESPQKTGITHPRDFIDAYGYNLELDEYNKVQETNVRKSYESDCQECGMESKSLLEDIRKLDGNILTLDQTIKESNEEIAKIDLQIRDVLKQHYRETLDLERAEPLQRMKRELEEEVNHKSTEHDNLCNEKLDLMTSLVTVYKKAFTLKKYRLEHVENLLRPFMKRSVSYGTDLNRIVDENDEEMDGETTSIQDRLRTFEASIDQVDQLRLAKKQISEINNQVDQHHNRLLDISSRREDLEAELNQLDEEESKLEADAEDQKGRLTGLHEEEEDLENGLNLARMDHTTLTQFVDEVKNHVKMEQPYLSSTYKLREEITELEQKMSTYEKKKDEFETKLKKQSSLVEIFRECNTLRIQISSCREKIQDYTSRIGSLNSQRTGLEEEVEYAIANGDLDEFKNLELDLENVKKQLSELEATRSRADEAIAEKKSKMEALIGEIDEDREKVVQEIRKSVDRKLRSNTVFRDAVRKKFRTADLQL